MNKWLLYAVLIIIGITISFSTIYGLTKFSPSVEAKDTAYSMPEYGAKTYEAYLEITNIPGSYPLEPNKDQIEIEEFSWLETNSGNIQGGTGTGRVEMENFQFIFEADPKASPMLFLTCAKGEFLEKAVLYVRSLPKKGETSTDFLKVTFHHVQITSFETFGNTYKGQRPLDAIAIEFSKIEFYYNERYYWWDLTTNTGDSGIFSIWG